MNLFKAPLLLGAFFISSILFTNNSVWAVPGCIATCSDGSSCSASGNSVSCNCLADPKDCPTLDTSNPNTGQACCASGFATFLGAMKQTQRTESSDNTQPVTPNPFKK